MRKVITAAVVAVILFFLKDYFRYSPFSGIILLGYVASIIYLLVALVFFLKTKRVSNSAPVSATRASSSSSPGCFWLGGLVGIGVLVYFMNEALGRYSFRSFLFADRLVKITGSLPPFISWGLVGLLIGAVYGSIVAWKKYHLPFSINLIPLGVLVLIVGSLFLVNHPLDYSAERNGGLELSENLKTDGSTTTKQLIMRRWKIVDIKGRNRDSFLKQRVKMKNTLDFKDNGKCYLSENGVTTGFLFYEMADDGKSFTFSDPSKNRDIKTVNIISLTKDELVIKSEIFQNDVAIFKPDD